MSPDPGPPAWFDHLVGRIRALDRPGAGLAATPFSRFTPPVGGAPAHSAVLALFGTGPDGPDLLLTQRATGMRSHPGQVAFPGGRIEAGDRDAAAAALREAQEETGVDPAGIDVHGAGPRLYLSVTDFYVTPVIAWWRRRSPVAAADTAEVSRVVAVPVRQLIDPARRFTVMHPSGFAGPAFGVAGMLIWGFTAGVISWLLELAGLEQAWDRERVLALPRDPVLDQAGLDRLMAAPPHGAGGLDRRMAR